MRAAAVFLRPPSGLRSSSRRRSSRAGLAAAGTQSAVANVLTAMALDSLRFPVRRPRPGQRALRPGQPARILLGSVRGLGDRRRPRQARLGVHPAGALRRRRHRPATWKTLIYRWPGQGLHKRAVKGLDLLGAIGTEEALNAVHRPSRSAPSYKGIKKAALAAMDRIAAGLGLDSGPVPRPARARLRAGPETAVTLDWAAAVPGRLRRAVEAVRHRRTRQGPQEPPETGRSRRRRSRLGGRRPIRPVEAAPEIGTEQVKRLERAMVAGRVWSSLDFDRYLSGHALMWHSTRRLVWQFSPRRMELVPGGRGPHPRRHRRRGADLA